jgi:hypothetical protein
MRLSAQSLTHGNGNNKMTSKNTSPLTESAPISTTVENLYSAYIASSEDLNSAGLNLISDLASELKNGCTQALMESTMKATAKGHNRPSVTASHVSSIPTASLIISAYLSADIDSFKPSKVLSVAVRVMSEVGASGVKAHVKQFATFAELDKGTKSKAESQADNASEDLLDEVAGKASAITLESIVDAVDVYLSQNDLKTLTTTDLEKLHTVIAKLITVESNTKALVA